MRLSLNHFSRLLLVVAVFFASGSQWAVLQTFAWSTMLLDFSRTGSVAEAVVKTFDGKHPCRICQEVRKERESGGKQETPAGVLKVELFHESVSPFAAVVPQRAEHAVVELFGPERTVTPGVPPPRNA